MIKDEGGIRMVKIHMGKKYLADNEYTLTEHVWADVFDKDKKEIYFMINFDDNGKEDRAIHTTNLRGYEKKFKSFIKKINEKAEEINANKLCKNDVADLELFDCEQVEDENFLGYIEACVLPIDTNECEPNCDHSKCRLILNIEIGMFPHRMSIVVGEYDLKAIMEKINKVAYLDTSQVKFNLSLTEVEILTGLLEKTLTITNEKYVDDITTNIQDEWEVSFIPDNCDEKAETKIAINFVRNQFEVSFTIKEATELLWAFKRLTEKYRPEISKLARSGVAKKWE